MKLVKTIVAISVSMLSLSVLAQTPTSEIQRNVKQQERIEQGLKSGQLTVKEAGKLEKQESKIEKMESNAMKDGHLSPQERERVKHEQNKVSNDIYREKHDAQTGNPNSPSSQRMQADVQRNVNQQSGIAQGVNSGKLSTREAARLERAQRRINRREARAAANGHVTASEQRRIQRAENHQHKHILKKKHHVHAN